MSAYRDLFEYTLERVTPKDISDFCLSDPGHPDYVREFEGIRSSRLAPTKSNFEICEVISAANLYEPHNEVGDAKVIRFRRFRTFTNAVAIALGCGTEGPNECMAPNYIAIRLVDDALQLGDSHLLCLLAPAFAEACVRAKEPSGMPEEAPFFLLAQLMLAVMGYARLLDTASLSKQLIAEEAQFYNRVSPEFLWGCTAFDSLHTLWMSYVKLAFPSGNKDADLAVLRDALLG